MNEPPDSRVAPPKAARVGTAAARLILYGSLVAHAAVAASVEPDSILAGLSWTLGIYAIAVILAARSVARADSTGEWPRWMPAVIGCSIGYLVYRLAVEGRGAQEGLAAMQLVLTRDWRVATIVVLIGPALEEFLFRGRIFAILAQHHGAAVAAVETGLAFVMTHVIVEVSWDGWTMRCWYALVLGAVRIWGKSVWASLATHVGLSSAILFL